MVAESDNILDSNKPPPIKKRTRIKINQPLATQNLDNPLPESDSTNEKGILSEVDAERKNLDNDQSSDDDGSRTYEINHKGKDYNEASGKTVIETDDEASTLESIHGSPINAAPKPAPRSKISQPSTVSDDDESCSGKINSEEENAISVKSLSLTPEPPQPRPRTVNINSLDETKPLKNKSKKMLKAADLISSVLKKESKKSHENATGISAVEEDKRKDEKDDDVASPWDSPPAPQVLDKVYIQNKHGFSVHDWADLFKKSDYKSHTPRNKCLTDVAVQFHDLWSRFMTFSHGVIAGIACCHILSVGAVLASTQNDVEQFVHFYHFLSLKVHFAVYVFTSLCIISCFDRLDIGELTKAHLRDIGRSHGTLLTSVAYLFCLMLSLAAHRHTAAIEDYKANHELWDSQGLQEWYWLVTTRDIVLLIIWIFIVFSPRSDLLREKLTVMRTKQGHADPIFSIDL